MKTPAKAFLLCLFSLLLMGKLSAQEKIFHATARLQVDFTTTTKNSYLTYKNQAYGAAIGFQIQKYYAVYLGYSRQNLAISSTSEKSWQANNYTFGSEGHIPIYQQFYFTLGGSLTIQQIENITYRGRYGYKNQTHTVFGLKAGPTWQNERFFAQAFFMYQQAQKDNLYPSDPYFLGGGLAFGVFIF